MAREGVPLTVHQSHSAVANSASRPSPARHRQRRDHRHRPSPTRADGPSQCIASPLKTDDGRFSRDERQSLAGPTRRRPGKSPGARSRLGLRPTRSRSGGLPWYGVNLRHRWRFLMDPYELQERQPRAEQAAEKVMRDVPRIRVERVISDGDRASRPGACLEPPAEARSRQGSSAPDRDRSGRRLPAARRARAGVINVTREPSDQGSARDSRGATDRGQRHAVARSINRPEVNMSSTDVGAGDSTEMAEVSTIDMGLEVVTIPVSDVDRALRFYQSLGWRLDIDIDLGDFRQVQMTPPRSRCSIHFGKGITSMEPGSHEKLYLAVKDIDAARADLLSRGIEVSEVEEQPKPPGFDLPGRSYFTYASFSDPDGNSWLLQEVTTRIPGRGWED